MNLNLRLGRGSFHPAWLLLLLPPLIGPHALELLDAPWFFPLLSAIPILLILVPITGVARRHPTSLSLRLGKEFRTLLPGALLAIVVPSLLLLSGERYSGPELAFNAYILGCTLLGATAFGAEFEQRTIGSLLTQPVRRKTLYVDKLLVLGVLLLVAASQFYLGSLGTVSSRSNLAPDGIDAMTFTFLIFVAPPLLAFCTGPLLSLRTRSTVASAVFTVALPLGLVLIGQLLLGQIWKWRHPGQELSQFAPHLETWCWIVIPMYVVFSACLGWHTFKTLELQGDQQAGSGSHPLAGALDRLLRFAWPHRGGGGTAMLIRKELRLQVVPWLVTTLILGSWIVLWLAKPLEETLPNKDYTSQIKELALFLAVMLGGINLLFIGSACVAEERQLGTLDWQLTCPATVRRQWWVKVSVAMGLSVLLGIALPVLMIASIYGEPRWSEVLPKEQWQFFVQGCCGVGITALAIYGSSISRSTIKAASYTIGVGAGVIAILFETFKLVSDGFEARHLELDQAWESNSLPPVTWAIDPNTVQGTGEILAMLSPILLVTVFLWAASINFRRGIPSGLSLIWQWVKMALILATLTAFIMSVMGFLMVIQHHDALSKQSRPQPRPQVKKSQPQAAAPILKQPQIDPALAARYGLTLRAGGTTNGATLSGSTNGAVARLNANSAMARRYGLEPRGVTPTNAPAPSK